MFLLASKIIFVSLLMVSVELKIWMVRNCECGSFLEVA